MQSVIFAACHTITAPYKLPPYNHPHISLSFTEMHITSIFPQVQGTFNVHMAPRKVRHVSLFGRKGSYSAIQKSYYHARGAKDWQHFSEFIIPRLLHNSRAKESSSAHDKVKGRALRESTNNTEFHVSKFRSKSNLDLRKTILKSSVVSFGLSCLIIDSCTSAPRILAPQFANNNWKQISRTSSNDLARQNLQGALALSLWSSSSEHSFRISPKLIWSPAHILVLRPKIGHLTPRTLHCATLTPSIPIAIVLIYPPPYPAFLRTSRLTFSIKLESMLAQLVSL